MKKIEIITQVKDGNFIRNRRTIKKAVEQFEGKQVVLIIQQKRTQRTNNQNSYYWGCIIPLMKKGLEETTGEVFSNTEVHEWLKSQFNFKELINEDTGEIIKLPKSTSDNSTTEQEVFHEEIRRFALEWFNIIIPLPNEDLKLDL